MLLQALLLAVLCALLVGVFLHFAGRAPEIQDRMVRDARAQEAAVYIAEHKPGIMRALCQTPFLISDWEPRLGPMSRFDVPMSELAFLSGHGKMARTFAHQCIREFCYTRLFLQSQCLGVGVGEEKKVTPHIILLLAQLMLPQLYIK